MFQPVVPFSGYAGWAFLQRTRADQEKTFNNSSEIERQTAYFREEIGKVKTADDLVSDRRLLKVALGAFGLDADIDSKAFIRKVLEEGSIRDDAFANRLADKRYVAFAKAFGFDLNTPRTALSYFGDEITSAFKTRQFEVAVGEQDENLRLAMSFDRDLGDALGTQGSENGRWYAVMGSPPLRKVFETALGLPSSFGRLGLEQQLEGFRDAADRRFGHGEVADFTRPEVQEKLIRMFLVRADLQASGTGASTGQAALTLLQSSQVSYSKLL